MCEILAVRWPRPTPFTSIEEWARKMEYWGAASHGWGVAWLEDDHVGRYRFPGRLAEDPSAARELKDVASTHYLVHLRRPNRLSTIQIADTQPFLAEGGRFAFCHNGTFKRDKEFRSQFAGILEGQADSEVGFRIFEEILDQGASAEEALARTHERLGGIANLGYLGADGELVIFNAYANNRFFRFRMGEAQVAATELHSPDDSLFNLIFTDATERRVITGGESLAQPKAAR